MPGPLARTILRVGAIVALVDGAFAVALDVLVLHLCTTSELFQHIASSLLGRRAAFHGGAAAAWLGVAIHVGVAYGWTVVFALAWWRWAALRRVARTWLGAVLLGLVFGVGIWLAMDLALVPLTRARATPPASRMFLIMLAWQALGVGAPLVLLVRRGLSHGRR